MDVSVIALLLALFALYKFRGVSASLTALRQEADRHRAEADQLRTELGQLRRQLTSLRAADPDPDPAAPVAMPATVPARPRPAPVAPLVAAWLAEEPAASVPEAAPAPAASPVPAPPGLPRPTAPPVLSPTPPRPPVPAPAPAGPTWWEHAAALLLENWTGILGAVVLVTGVGFLGIYAALRLAPPYRFLLICAFAAGLLGARRALRAQPFARQLSAWLLSSAAAIFLFACVGAVSIAGLRWATPPFDYLLLLAGVSANLYLAWRSRREDVATLHGVLSLVALAVLPPTALTLAAAAAVTAFSIAITYRQQWQYQLLLSIASFFVFHLYWHRQLAAISGGLRVAAMGLVLLVGAAAAVVQYRSVWARRRFEPLPFAAHVLNWTCLGINLFLYSTGSVWKTLPLGLGALLTFWTGRQARRLGIGWLFQTDTIISLLLALATALSLQGWHATPLVIGLFMLLEALLIALIMARQGEALVYRVALSAALLAGTGLLVLALPSGAAAPSLAELYRQAAILALAGWAGLAFMQMIFRQPLLQNPDSELNTINRPLLGGLAGLAGLLQAGAGLGLESLVFGGRPAPVGGLLAALLGLAGSALGLAAWVRAAGLAPAWVRRQQLVLAQFFAVLAIFGLHRLGLRWPGVGLVLYAESLLVAALLSGRREEGLRRAQTYLLVGLALLLPGLVRYLPSLAALVPLGRSGLLLGAALLTLAYQARRLSGRFEAEAEVATLPLGGGYRLPALGAAVGWLVLGAAALECRQPWAGWALVGGLGALLALRRRVAVPGLWAGLVLAGTGYLALQWSHVLHPLLAGTASYPAGYVALYLLPTLAVPGAGVLASWWPAGGRYVRGPWLYLLAAHLVVGLGAAVPARHVAYLTLGLLALGGAAFAGARAWRRALPDAAAVARAGQPDRYLLHLSYALLLSTLLAHLALIHRAETFVGLPAEYFTAALLFGTLAAVALARPPATEPTYRSWGLLHRWLPEAALLFGTLTLAHNLRAAWLPLLWVSAALGLSGAAGRLPARFRRVGLYGRLYYWLAAATVGTDALAFVSGSYVLSAGWWALVAAAALLFGYVGLALRGGSAAFAGLGPGWAWLARPTRRQLEAGLLYPAFAALSLLVIQSFDRSVLTVLLMLEVLAVFSTSLLLRRQDLRYLALAGMLGCLLRLVFFDLRQSNTITRAIVFIIMGLLLLGMNALYARFKARFAPEPAAGEEPPPAP